MASTILLVRQATLPEIIEAIGKRNQACRRGSVPPQQPDQSTLNTYPVSTEDPCFEGGAILDDDGRMIGSATIVEFPDRAAVDAWLARDPYVTGKVWQKI